MCLSEADLTTYAALRAGGLSRRRIASQVSTAALLSVRRGVFARPGVCAARTDAALHGGAIACVTAARHLGLWVLDESTTVHVWLGAHGRTRPHDACGCVSHWDDGAPSSAFGIPSVPRILRQILTCFGVEAFFVTLESARRLGRITTAGLAWLRMHTSDAARDAIDYSRTDADSGLESLLRWRLRGHRLRIRTQVRIVSVGTVDFLIGDYLVIEVDGRVNHDGESHRHKDLVRDAQAAAWGFTTLRFDYAMIVHDWPVVESAIMAHVDRRHHLRPVVPARR